MDTQPTSSTPTAHSGNFLKQMEDFFDLYFNKKAPFHLPANVKEWIVKYSPWIDLVLLLLTVSGALAILRYLLYALQYGGRFGNIVDVIEWVFILAAFILEACAVPGLFKRSMKSWRLLYYGALLTAVGSLLSYNILNFIV